MYYRNNSETTTSDWLSLNFNAIHGPLVAQVVGDDYDALERVGSVEEPDIEEPTEPDEPERPEPLEGMTALEYDVLLQTYAEEKAAWDKAMVTYLVAQKAYDDAWAEYEEERESFENLHGFPVAWNRMWTSDERVRPDDVQALVDSGFVVYDTGNSNIDFGFNILFGVDGGGYDFYEAHFRPLRARFSRIRALRYPSAGALSDHNALVEYLASEGRGSTEPDHEFIRQFSL